MNGSWPYLATFLASLAMGIVGAVLVWRILRRPDGRDDEGLAPDEAPFGRQRAFSVPQVPVADRETPETETIAPTVSREHNIRSWRGAISGFEVDPVGALRRCDVVLSHILLDLGHAERLPIRMQDGATSDLLARLCAARSIVDEHALGMGGVDDLRDAMVRMQMLFDDLVNEPGEGGPTLDLRPGRRVVLREAAKRRA